MGRQDWKVNQTSPPSQTSGPGSEHGSLGRIKDILLLPSNWNSVFPSMMNVRSNPQNCDLVTIESVGVVIAHYTCRRDSEILFMFIMSSE